MALDYTANNILFLYICIYIYTEIKIVYQIDMSVKILYNIL